MNAKLETIRPSESRARRVREKARRALEECEASLGDRLSGFALVAWGRRGAPVTAYMTTEGPIHPLLVPSYVANALDRHITQDVTENGGEKTG